MTCETYKKIASLAVASSKISLYISLYISSRVEMQCLLYEPATLVSNKADCSYCGPLLQSFCHFSALTLQNGCNNARYEYFTRLRRRTGFVGHRKLVVSVADR